MEQWKPSVAWHDAMLPMHVLRGREKKTFVIPVCAVERGEECGGRAGFDHFWLQKSVTLRIFFKMRKKSAQKAILETGCVIPPSHRNALLSDGETLRLEKCETYGKCVTVLLSPL